MANHEQIIQDFKNKCRTIILNHTPNPGLATIAGISRIPSIVAGMGAQLNDINTEITAEASRVLATHSNTNGIDKSKLKEDLFLAGKEIIAEYLKNNKPK
jgi:hypothetical protein